MLALPRELQTFVVLPERGERPRGRRERFLLELLDDVRRERQILPDRLRQLRDGGKQVTLGRFHLERRGAVGAAGADVAAGRWTRAVRHTMTPATAAASVSVARAAAIHARHAVGRDTDAGTGVIVAALTLAVVEDAGAPARSWPSGPS